jgi:hypothetical protein
VDEYHLCDLCTLNRATLHLDEVVSGVIQQTAHLCDDCWYRLGIRIPLGNIWRHIERNRKGYVPPLERPPDDLAGFLSDEDLGDLLDPSPLAVAEPEGPPPPPEELLGDDMIIDDEPPSRIDRISSEPPLGDPAPQPPSDKIGMDAVRVGETHPALVSLLPRDLLLRCKAVPVRLDGMRLLVAISDPFDTLSIANIEMYLEHLGLSLALAIGDEVEILRELQRHGSPPGRFDSLS